MTDRNSFNHRGNAWTTEFDNQDGSRVLIEIIRLRSTRVICPRGYLFAAMPITERKVIQTRLISACIGNHIVLLCGRSEPVSQGAMRQSNSHSRRASHLLIKALRRICELVLPCQRCRQDGQLTVSQKDWLRGKYDPDMRWTPDHLDSIPNAGGPSQIGRAAS